MALPCYVWHERVGWEGAGVLRHGKSPLKNAARMGHPAVLHAFTQSSDHSLIILPQFTVPQRDLFLFSISHAHALLTVVRIQQLSLCPQPIGDHKFDSTETFRRISKCGKSRAWPCGLTGSRCVVCFWPALPPCSCPWFWCRRSRHKSASASGLG